MEKSASKESAKKKKFAWPKLSGPMEFLLVFTLATVITLLVAVLFRQQIFDLVISLMG